jgi:hypothetical protein
VLLANLDSLMAKAGENYWEAVTGFINFDTAQEKKTAGKGKSATPRQSIVPEVKAGRQTDLARFRQVSSSSLCTSASKSCSFDCFGACNVVSNSHILQRRCHVWK